MTTGVQIAKLIHATRFRFVDERELQDSVASILTAAGISFDREFALNPKDRIDFLCTNVGIEVKVAGAANAVFRQLWRYMADERVKEIVLVTTRSSHLSIQRTIDGKPVFVAHLLNSIF
jgi:hypothetical protein